MKIAIVTGCAGFIGLNFTKNLLQNGWRVYGIDKLTYVANKHGIRVLKKLFKDRFKFINSDINNLTWLPEADVLFNFAAESDVDNSNADCSSFVKSNVLGVQKLLDLMSKRIIIRNDKPLFIQISTDEVYGDLETGSFSEYSSVRPSNPYAATKAAADLLIQSWHRTHGLDFIIVRPSNNYGPYQYPEKLIPLAVKRLNRGKKIKLHNNGDPIRTWTHVEDTVNAILTVYYRAKVNRIYNISSEFEQTNRETVQQILNAYFGKKTNLEDYVDYSYNRSGQDIRYSISCIPLNELGWKPEKEFAVELPLLVSKYKGTFKW